MFALFCNHANRLMYYLEDIRFEKWKPIGLVHKQGRITLSLKELWTYWQLQNHPHLPQNLFCGCYGNRLFQSLIPPMPLQEGKNVRCNLFQSTVTATVTNQGHIYVPIFFGYQSLLMSSANHCQSIDWINCNRDR